LIDIHAALNVRRYSDVR